MDERGEHAGFDREGMGGLTDLTDLTSLSDDELRAEVGRLSAQERRLDYELELVRGRLGVIRAELVGRDAAALSPEDLARVLMGGSPGGTPWDNPGERP